jgi:hypothetical protein
MKLDTQLSDERRLRSERCRFDDIVLSPLDVQLEQVDSAATEQAKDVFNHDHVDVDALTIEMSFMGDRSRDELRIAGQTQLRFSLSAL